MTERFDLMGYVRAAENRSGFAVLVFRTDGSNGLFGQVVDGTGVVAGFAPLDPPSFVAVEANPALVQTVGEEALWAYCLPDEAPVIGHRRVVAEELRNRLPRIPDPLLRLQAAEFCDAPTARAEAWRGSFDALARAAPASARAWRDLVVLPRQVRNAVAKIVRADGILLAGDGLDDPLKRDLGSAVGVEVRDGVLRVTLEARLFDLLGTKPSALAEIEADVAEVREAFRLGFDPIIRSRPDEPPRHGLEARTGRRIVAAGDHAVAVVDAMLRSPERRARPAGRGGHGSALLRSGDHPLVVADHAAVLHRLHAPFDDVPDLLGDPPEHGASILPMVFPVSAHEVALVDRIASLADAARRRGWVPVAVVPHLPDPNLMRDPDEYRRKLERIDGAFVRTWLISEQSAHGRSGLPFGPSRSVDAAASRLAELLPSLPPASELLRVGGGVDGAIAVDVLSSAVAGLDLSPPRLLERALGRATDASLRIGSSTKAEVDLPAAAASPRMDEAERLLGEMVPGGGHVTWTHPHGRPSARSSVRLARVQWVPMALSDFDEACVAEIERHGWRLEGTDVAGASHDAVRDGLRVPIAFRATGGSNATRPLGSRTVRRGPDDVLLLTDATVHRGDFARQLVNGRMPLHFGRVVSLATIWRQRHRHLVRALRGTAALQDRTVARAALDLLRTLQASGRLDGRPSRLVAGGAELDEERSFVARLPDAVRVDLALVTGDGSRHGFGVILAAGGWIVDDRRS